MQFRILCSLALLLIAAACSTEQSSQRSGHKYPTINGVRQLSGEEAAALISGKSVVGYYESSSGSYVDFFDSDGRFASSAFDNDIYQGSWVIMRDRVCISVTNETPSPHRCVTLIATNDQYVAFRPGGKGIFRITGIRQGNFKNLPLK